MQVRPARRRNVALELLPARRRSAAILWWLLPVFVVGGWFYPYIGLLMPICMLAPVAIAPIRGRYWCGWVCPRGSFFDYIMGRFSRNKPAPKWLRSKGFRLGMLAFLMTMMTTQIVLAGPDLQAIGRVFITLLAVTSIVGIGLALAYRPRTWCGFCPMGTMASWFAHGKRPLHTSSACTSCPACTKLCPMGISPHKPDNTHSDCIKCTRCVTVCPRKAISFVPLSQISPEPQSQPAEQGVTA